MFRNVRLGTRLFVAQSVAIVGAVLAAALVALVIGPRIFHEHLVASGEELSEPAVGHIEAAFASASALSLGLGLAVALLLAIGLTWYATSRIRRPLRELTAAATRVSSGEYDVRVRADAAGPELATLGEAFNEMSARLGSVEDTRRRLLSDLAHELRTPTATISSHVEGVADGVVEWNSTTEQVLAHQVQRLARLANDLDEVSRAEEGRITLDLELVDLAEAVELACQQFVGSFNGAHVGLTWDAMTVEARFDPLRVSQVLGILLGNALRHTPTGGHVHVAGVLDDQRRSVVLSVTDDGEGMSKEQLSHAFERFYRGDSARAADTAGSGIGLTIARAIAKAHEGTLTAKSSGLGHGATFTLTLPQRARHRPG